MTTAIVPSPIPRIMARLKMTELLRSDTPHQLEDAVRVPPFHVKIVPTSELSGDENDLSRTILFSTDPAYQTTDGSAHEPSALDLQAHARGQTRRRC